MSGIDACSVASSPEDQSLNALQQLLESRRKANDDLRRENEDLLLQINLLQRQLNASQQQAAELAQRIARLESLQVVSRGSYLGLCEPPADGQGQPQLCV
jgi:chromosome segregation ATPase